MSSPMWDIPDHFLILVNENGEGPVSAEEAVALACWCGAGICPGPEDEGVAE